MDYALNDRYLREEGTVYMTGVQALVRVLLDRARQDRARGQRSGTFVSGYEGSPLGGYDLEIIRQAKLLTELDIVHRPGVNEELAATGVMGTQVAAQAGPMRVDGISAVWYGKSPGLDRASDALRHANLIGTDPRGGAVALAGDDPAAKSSTVPCASETTLADLAMPTLYPGDTQDALDFGLHAFYLSRYTGLWSALKVTTAMADGASTAQVSPDRITPAGGPGTHRPSARLLGAELAGLERSLHTVRLPRALEYARRNGLNRIIPGAPGERIGIVAAGKTYFDVREALDLLGLDLPLLKLGMIWPVEPEIVTEFAGGLDQLIVVEEKRAFIETSVKDILYGRAGAPAVHGKRDASGETLFAAPGELDADAVVAGLARVLGRPAPARREQIRMLPLLARTPYFCSGCPHNSSTKADPDAVVGGGIGCHAMVLLMPPEQVGHVVGLTQMGGEGAQFIGLAPFAERDHFIQNIGDGTFFHSGSLAVRASVAAGMNVTYKLLYNSAVAMTGGQSPAGGQPLGQLVRLLQAEGAVKVVVTTDDAGRTKRAALPSGVEVRPRDDLLAVQAELARVPGVTVLIHDQECAAEKRRKRRRGTVTAPAAKVVINERICEGCGDCGAKSNCLSVHPVATEFGRKTRIHQSSCNADYSCLDGDCPSFVTVIPGQGRARTAPPEIGELPDPVMATSAGRFRMRITGIGGTGIVTVAQVLATAAAIEDRQVRALDQTGLAQKGGAVVSDLTVTAAPAQLASKLGEGRCDLYLGCDALVATDDSYLKAAAPDRTIAVISVTETPTGAMVTDTSVTFPEQAAVRSAVDAATARAAYLDAGAIARQNLDDEQYANMILVGAAYQAGALPIGAPAIEQAITLNGVAVAANIAAFRLGRQAIARPAPDPAGHPAGDATDAAQEPADLDALLARRAADLAAYQDESYARAYADFVAVVRAAERDRTPGETAITEAVTRYLHKLMAYKDEYEVARLALDPEFGEQITAAFGPGSAISYRLHPPVLRAMGLKHKVALGPWFRPAFRGLRAARRLRGTPADVFGYAPMRRLERELITEYRASVTAALGRLRPDTHELVAKIAVLPDQIRGYEQVKLDNVARYRSDMAALQADLAAVRPAAATAAPRG